MIGRGVEMSQKGLEVILQEIENRFSADIFEIGEFRGQTYVIIKNKEKVREIVRFLKEQKFLHLQTLTAVDYLNLKKLPRFEVVYQFYNLEKRLSLRLRVQVPEEEPEIDSIVDLYPVANFLEREVFDLFGISFKGHPNLKRILLPNDWKGHPLRKDYPLEPEEKPESLKNLILLKERITENAGNNA